LPGGVLVVWPADAVSEIPSGPGSTAGKETSLEPWVRLVRGEYLTIPELHLTLDQVQRLWQLDPFTGEKVLKSLVHDSFLRKTDDGAFVRPRVGPAASDERRSA
jgi:hypothetical protein